MYRNIIFLLFTLTLFSPAILVNAYDILQILFDDYHAGSCSDYEWWRIDDAIYILSQQERVLRSSATPKEDVPVDDMNRALWPNYCANRCDGFEERTCKALNCKGYRRSMIEKVTRNLFWNSDCDTQIYEINTLLDSLRRDRSFSRSCRWYLSLPRQFGCFTDDTCEPIRE